MEDFLTFIFGRLVDSFILATGRRVLPIISAGRIVARPADVPFRWFQPVKRLPDGRIGVDTFLVLLTGSSFWLALVVGLVAFFHYLSIR